MHAIECVELQLDPRGEQHQPGGVDDDVDTTERFFDSVEEGGCRLLVGHVQAHGDRFAASGLGIGDGSTGRLAVARVCNYERVTIVYELLDDAPSDAARAASDNRNARFIRVRCRHGIHLLRAG